MKRTVVLLLLLGTVLIGGHCDGDDDFFFIVIHSAADLNLDGFADLVIGVPGHDGGGLPGARRGAVFVHFGSTTGPSPAPGLTIFGAEDGAEFGTSLTFVGDVNGRGAPDLLVGAPLDDGDDDDSEDGTDRGRAFVFFGGSAMDANPDVTLTGAEPGAMLGYSVTWVGDTNRDGFDDWVVGAPLDDGDGNASDDALDRGRAFFYFGSDPPDDVADLVLTGPEIGSEFGSAVASAGDLNDRGAWDIAVGAPLDDADGNASDEGADRGRVYVYYGGSALDAAPDLTFSGDEDGAELGSAVAPVLDVDDDGIDDLLVGAPLHDAGAGLDADRGEAYVFLGGVTPDAIPDLTLSGDTDGGSFGAAVGGAGDVDGDGERDFLVGAPLEDPAALADAGSAYLFLGGAGLDALPDLFFDGAEEGGRFGATLAGPGDFDDDGGRDFAIAAPSDDADANATDDALDRGRTFVFLGGSGVLDDVADATLNGSQDQGRAGTGIAN